MFRKPKALAYVVIERSSGWYWVLAKRSVELRVVATGRDALPDPGFHAVNDTTAGSGPGAPTSDARKSPNG
jgi:hypothetical protein